MPVIFRTAPVSLDILVIGGGVGGLAAAFMLSKSGHRVKVIERSTLDAPSGGQRLPPNLSKILRQWVGEEELSKVATRCVGTPFYHWETGEYVGRLEWKPLVMAETGGEFLVIHRKDLIRMLHKLAAGAGATILCNSEVVSIQPGSASRPEPTVTLRGGNILTADLIVGADGSMSITRHVVLDGEDCSGPCELTVYSGVINGDDIRDDNELGPRLQHEQWPIWMGNQIALHAHPISCGKDFSFSLYSWKGSPSYQPGEEASWDEQYRAAELPRENGCPELQKMLKIARHVTRTHYMSRPQGISEWVDSTGRIVLLGDSAHPPLPAGTHPASLAVEDAVVLGSLLSHLRTLDQLPSLLNAYEEIRRQRCTAIVAADIGTAKTMSLPPGPEADARNANMRQTLNDMDEGTLKAQFEEFAEIFCYDAGDAAEEWWINWGRFHDRACASKKEDVMDFVVSNVVVELHA